MADEDPLCAHEVLIEFARRGGNVDALIPKDEARRIPQLLDPKHAKQFAAFSDPSPKLAIDAGGRSGKTTGSIRWLMEGALEALRSMNPFIGLTRAEAKLLAWDEIKAVNDQFNLGFEFNEADLIARAPNGAKVWVTGADQQKHIRKMRGHKYRRIVLEESGVQGRHLKELVEDVLEPRTADLNGQICLLGTPNAARAGFFFDACHGVNGVRGYSHHHWTLFDNPYLPHARAWVEKNLFGDRGWTDEHATYQREYLGRWVRDDSAMVYDYREDRNTYAVLPEVSDGWRSVLGIDFGWRAASAFHVWGWHPTQPALHELYAMKRPKMTVTAIMKQVEKLHETYGFKAIVGDPGGLGVTIIEELNERWRKELKGIEIEPAQKTAKKDHIVLFNDDLRAGKVKVRPQSPLVDEWILLQWDESGDDEDARFENHSCDAALYSWRRAQHYRHKPKIEQPAKGTAAWERQHEREITKKLEQKHRPKGSTTVWETTDPLSKR